MPVQINVIMWHWQQCLMQHLLTCSTQSKQNKANGQVHGPMELAKENRATTTTTTTMMNDDPQPLFKYLRFIIVRFQIYLQISQCC